MPLPWLAIYPLVSLVIVYFGAKLTEPPVWEFTIKSFAAFATLIPLALFAYAVRYGITLIFPETTLTAAVLASMFVFSVTATVI